MLPFYLNPPDPSHLLSEPFIVLDFETTNTDHGDSRTPENRIVLAATAPEGHEPRLVDPRRPHMIPQRCLLVAHNAKFELGWLLRMGYDLTNVLVWDTMIAEYVLNGNQRKPLDLDSVAKAWEMQGKEPVIDALMKGGVCPSEMPIHFLERRVLLDVKTTRDLFLEQRAEIKSKGLLPVMFTRCIATPVLAYIEREGMTLDPARVREDYNKTQQELTEVEAELSALSGGINMRSGPQVAKFLYETLGFQELTDRRGNVLRTAGGKPRTDKEALAALKPTTVKQKRFLGLRQKHAKLAHTMSSSLSFFQGVCDEYGGRFMGNFHQTRTKTHRLASSGRKLAFADGTARAVQFQNMERGHKRLFKPRDDGYVMVEADGSGLEFRIAVDLARDQQGLEDILNPDHDVHTFTATVINGCPAEEVTKEMRTAAKRHTFKPLFSTGNSGSKAEVRYYQEFKNRYAAITALQDKWIGDVMRTGQLTLPSGLICYWQLKMTHTGYVEGSNEVRNLPIQSFATADIIPVSLVFTFWRSRYTVAARLVNTVHDSVVAEVAEEDVARYKDIIVKSFLQDTPQYLKDVYRHSMFVPLGVGITVGPHWGEGAEESITGSTEVNH